jgi:integrase
LFLENQITTEGGFIMSITQIVNKKGEIGYLIRVGLGKDQTGKYHFKQRTIFGPVRLAQEVEAQMQAAVYRARAAESEQEIYQMQLCAFRPISGRIKLRQAFDRALENPQNQSTSEEKIHDRRRYWNDYVLWMMVHRPSAKFMNDVMPEHIAEYIKFVKQKGFYSKYRKKEIVKKLSNHTINCVLKGIRSVFELTKKETGIFENPASEVKLLPEKNIDREAYTEEQLKIIFAKADGYMYPLFFIGLFTGLSEGDICTLKKSEIMFQHEHIYRKRNKTLKSSGKTSCIPMLPILQDYLLKLVNDPENETEYVLPEAAEDYLHDRSKVSRKIKKFLTDDCGFSTYADSNRTKLQSVLDFHSLRHTFCSIAGVVGIPLTVVKSIVGHMNQRMTELYARHVENQERLRWIKVFGERLQSLPNLPAQELCLPAPDPERLELEEAIRDIDITLVRKFLKMIHDSKRQI